MTEHEEASVLGKGEEMIPEQGLPFEVQEVERTGPPPQPGEPSVATAGAFPPADAEAFPETAPLRSGAGATAGVVDLTPRDLSPEELAAILPGSHEERVPAGPAAAPAAEAAVIAAEAEPPAAAASPPGNGAGESAAPPGQPPPGARPYRGSVYDRPRPAPASEPRPATASRVADDKLVEFLVTDVRLEKLWLRADAARRRVNENISFEPLALMLLDLLEEARNLMLARRDNYEEAERRIAEVEFRLERDKNIEEWSRTYGYALYVYEAIILLLLGLSMAFLEPMVQRYAQATTGTVLGATGSDSVRTAVSTVIWGGLGGVSGALYSLWIHIARDQDFDKQHTVRYLSSPVMGMMFGGFTYMIVRAGLLALIGGSEADSVWLIYALAWIMGFQQSAAYRLVQRVLKFFKLTEDLEEETAAGKTATAASGGQ